MTNTNTIEAKIHANIQIINRQIEEVKNDILQAAKLYVSAAEYTLDQATQLKNEQASGINSGSFTPSGMANGTDAYVRLQILVEKRNLLEYLLRDNK